MLSQLCAQQRMPLRNHKREISCPRDQDMVNSLPACCSAHEKPVRRCVFLSTKISGRRRSHFSCAVFLAMTPVCLRVRHCENFPACFFPSRAPRRTLVPLDTRLRRKFRLGCWSVSYLKTFGYSSRTYLKTYRFSCKKSVKNSVQQF